MENQEQQLKEEIIKVGKRLYDTGIAIARSGNISCRLDAGSILITATGTSLGSLIPEGIVTADLVSGTSASERKPSSEFPLHSRIYAAFPCAKIIHAHPPLTNGYFAVSDSLKALTFETSMYLGNVPVVPQETPSVTDTAPVLAALKASNVVVLKNHGVVAVGETFEDALGLIETLEEAVRTAAVARLFRKETPDVLDTALRANLQNEKKAFPMFSRQHIEAIVELVNKDEFIAAKGKEMDLTVQMVIKLDEGSAAYRLNFEKGRVIRIDEDDQAPFVISAGRNVWEMVFTGQLDPFVAVTQGKMKLAGQLGQLSRWYVPFSRLFQLFKQVEIV